MEHGGFCGGVYALPAGPSLKIITPQLIIAHCGLGALGTLGTGSAGSRPASRCGLATGGQILADPELLAGSSRIPDEMAACISPARS